MTSKKQVLVIGGGISGLAAAHRLVELAGPSVGVEVLESTERLGGIIRTERFREYVIERGPDAILTEKPAAMGLAHRLGLQNEMIRTRPEFRGAYVLCRGSLRRIPAGFSLLAPSRFGPLLSSDILSARGKARVFGDLFVPRGDPSGDESVAAFVRRRYGSEMLDRIAEPLLGGIYGTDPDQLSLASALPRFAAIEDKHRSVTLGLRKERNSDALQQASGVRYGMFISFSKGVQTLVDALKGALGTRIQYGATVRELSRSANRWSVQLDNGSSKIADAIVIALPAWRAVGLVQDLDAELADLLAGISYGSAVGVTFAWKREAIGHPLDAFGFVVPRIEKRQILAATWSSQKWENRCPEGMVLMRAFLGGPHSNRVVRESDEVLIKMAQDELSSLLQIKGSPSLVRIDRWIRASPAYTIGHRKRVDRIERRAGDHRHLVFAGGAYRGVGIPDCVQSGEQAAERLVSELGVR